jgi:hypothetical protein
MSLYGSRINRETQAAEFQRIAVKQLPDRITITERWLEEVNERMKTPADGGLFSRFSKPVELSPDISGIINTRVIDPVKSAITNARAKVKSSAITYELYNSFRENVQTAFNSIASDTATMEILKTRYPRLYRAFANKGGSLTKKDGSNLFRSRNSSQFFRMLTGSNIYIARGGKQTKKQRKQKKQKKQPKQKRRRTIRR